MGSVWVNFDPSNGFFDPKLPLEKARMACACGARWGQFTSRKVPEILSRHEGNAKKTRAQPQEAPARGKFHPKVAWDGPLWCKGGRAPALISELGGQLPQTSHSSTIECATSE